MIDILNDKSYSLNNSTLQEIESPFPHITIKVKRDDLLSINGYPSFCGNKWRKLKYNISEAKRQQVHTLLTFGGAYSNHIAALADAGALFDFNTIGVIRGEEIFPLNPTLARAKNKGMLLWPISRSLYRQKETQNFVSDLIPSLQSYFTLPEGGTNTWAIKGSSELIHEIQQQNAGKAPDYICACCGTGGTLTGLIAGSLPQTKVIGFPVLKGNFMESVIKGWLQRLASTNFNPWELQNEYHFGGYGKFKPELINFINEFNQNYGISLDPIYTGKLFYGVFDLAQKGYFKPYSTVVILHSGGLQGISGFNDRFGNLINI